MVLIIIATKLCQPFDGIKRIPEHDINPSALVIDWREWNKIMEEPDIGVSRKGEAMGLKDTDVMTMSGQNLDDYMDWFQRTWLEDKEAKSTYVHFRMFLVLESITKMRSACIYSRHVCIDGCSISSSHVRDRGAAGPLEESTSEHDITRNARVHQLKVRQAWGKL